MRGDSRRDLYSKALALCGLGVLAGAGALVDYWPVGIRFPSSASFGISDQATALAPLAVPYDAFERGAVRTAAFRPALVVTKDEPSLEPLPISVSDLDFGRPVHVAELPPPAFVNVRREMPLFQGPSVVLTAPDAGMIAPVSVLAANVSDDDGRDGFFRTAFRRTGSSIVRTGVKTGSSLVGAVRIVSNVVRRALPN